MVEVVERRRAERERLIGVARSYVERLSSRMNVLAAAVVGSVARGDFNVWSDIDVVVVCEELPERLPDRLAALALPDAPGVQAVGFTADEFATALSKANPLARAVSMEGMVLVGADFFSSFPANL